MNAENLRAAQALFARGRAMLVLGHPFFAGVMLKFDVVWTDTVPTAAVYAAGRRLMLNPDFVMEHVQDTGRMVFLLCHECLHYMWLHAARRGGRAAQRWNEAADAVINESLVAWAVGTFIGGGVRWPGAEAMSAEQVYALMPEGQQSSGGLGDDLPGDDTPTPGELQEIEAQVKADVAQAARAAKMHGTIAGGLQAAIGAIIDVPTPWHAVLERHMTALVREDATWKRPSRRSAAVGAYLPGKVRQPGLGTVVVGIDTSGSVSADELAHFGGHVRRIIEQCGPERAVVIYCDAEVQRVDEYDGEEIDFALHVTGRGGTAFAPVFDEVARRGLTPDVLVYLTDGDGERGVTAPAYPVIWASTTGATSAAFGEVLDIRTRETGDD